MITYWKKRPVRVFIFIAVLLFPVLGIFFSERSGNFAAQLGSVILSSLLGYLLLQICFARSLRYAAGTGKAKSFFIGLIPLTLAIVLYTLSIGAPNNYRAIKTYFDGEPPIIDLIPIELAHDSLARAVQHESIKAVDEYVYKPSLFTRIFPDEWIFCGFCIGLLEAAMFPLIVGMVRRSRYNRLMDQR